MTQAWRSDASRWPIWTVWMLLVLIGLAYLGSRASRPQADRPHSAKSIDSAEQTLPAVSLSAAWQRVLALHTLPVINNTFDVFVTKEMLSPPPTAAGASAMASTPAASSPDISNLLWRKGQHQLMQVEGSVQLGINLLDIVPTATSQWLNVQKQQVTFPAVQILDTQIDNVTMYDARTGERSTVQLGLSLLSDSEIQVLNQQLQARVCAGGALSLATQQAEAQLTQMFRAMGSAASVRILPSSACTSSGAPAVGAS